MKDNSTNVVSNVAPTGGRAPMNKGILLTLDCCTICIEISMRFVCYYNSSFQPKLSFHNTLMSFLTFSYIE